MPCGSGGRLSLCEAAASTGLAGKAQVSGCGVFASRVRRVSRTGVRVRGGYRTELASGLQEILQASGLRDFPMVPPAGQVVPRPARHS